MRKAPILACGFVVMVATAASAQTKFAGTQACAKPDPNYSLSVGDTGDHVVSLTKDKCK